MSASDHSVLNNIVFADERDASEFSSCDILRSNKREILAHEIKAAKGLRSRFSDSLKAFSCADCIAYSVGLPSRIWAMRFR